MGNYFSRPEEEEEIINEEAAGKVNVAYFFNWAIYARKHFPKDVPVKNLTHVLYAFADVKTDTGEVFLTDSWADEQIHYDGDSRNDQGNNLYGNLKQFGLLKKANRNLKLLLSIGGWTYSAHFQPVASNPTLRSKFVSSALKLLEDYGLDGFDIDWEYPANDQEAQDYVDLLKEMRQALTQLSKSKDTAPYLLTIAAPCGPNHYTQLKMKEMDKYLNFWNLMAYDYAGSWSTVTGNQANLYGPAPSTQVAVDYYIKQGVPANKLVMGMPLYGRSFEKTDGLGKPYQGLGQGSWEAGLWDYKVLPQSGAKEKFDAQAGAVYSYDKKKKTFISYDNPDSVKMKADYIKSKRMRGAMFWETSGDATTADRSLIANVAKELGPQGVKWNHIDYPESKFDNVKKQFA